MIIRSMERPVQIGVLLSPIQYKKYKLAVTVNETNMSDPIREFIDRYIVQNEKRGGKHSLVD